MPAYLTRIAPRVTAAVFIGADRFAFHPMQLDVAGHLPLPTFHLHHPHPERQVRNDLGEGARGSLHDGATNL